MEKYKNRSVKVQFEVRAVRKTCKAAIERSMCKEWVRKRFTL